MELFFKVTFAVLLYSVIFISYSFESLLVLVQLTVGIILGIAYKKVPRRYQLILWGFTLTGPLIIWLMHQPNSYFFAQLKTYLDRELCFKGCSNLSLSVDEIQSYIRILAFFSWLQTIGSFIMTQLVLPNRKEKKGF